MPWPPKQRAAIAARMKRQGKSPEEIAAFFREHGHGDRGKHLMNASKKKGK
jgi:DNA-binding CsgD family transcriptional regulator